MLTKVKRFVNTDGMGNIKLTTYETRRSSHSHYLLHTSDDSILLNLRKTLICLKTQNQVLQVTKTGVRHENESYKRKWP